MCHSFLRRQKIAIEELGMSLPLRSSLFRHLEDAQPRQKSLPARIGNSSQNGECQATYFIGQVREGRLGGL